MPARMRCRWSRRRPLPACTDRLPSARAGLRFDLERWLAQYRARPQAIAGLSTELQLQHAVLQLSPVAAIDTDSTGSAYLEALLMDPAYQLK